MLSETKSLAQSETLTQPVFSQADPITVALQTYYRSQDRLPGLIFPDEYSHPIADINLSIIEYKTERRELKEHKEEKEKKERKEEKDAATSETALAHYEELHNVRHPIPVKDIFDCFIGSSGKLETNPAKKLLILGAPGIGKTTMSQFLAHQWSSEAKLFRAKFDYVFWVPLRNLPTLMEQVKEKKLSDIIHRECLKNNKSISISGIEYILTKKRDRTLIIADGYDEIAALLTESLETDPGSIASILREMLGGGYLILTSRPYQLDHLPVAQFRRLENTGFTDQNVVDYVTRYFAQLKSAAPEQGKSLLTFLKTHPSLWGTAHIPINLALVCEETHLRTKEQKEALEKRRDEEKKAEKKEERKNESEAHFSVRNMTGLYQHLTEFLLKRYLESKRKINCRNRDSSWIIQQCSLELEFLGRLAFEGLRSNQINLSPVLQRDVLKSIEEHQERKRSPFDAVLQSGFLRSNAERTEEINKPHYFIHLTFQEFLTAFHLVKYLKQPAETKEHRFAEDFIRHRKYVSHYHVVFGFMAGLLSNDKSSEPSDALKIFWNLLQDEPRDLTQVVHTRLMIHCLEESGCGGR